MSGRPLRWGLLAAGGIARAFAAGLKQTDTGDAFAVASRSEERATAFAAEYDIPRVLDVNRPPLMPRAGLDAPRSITHNRPQGAGRFRKGAAGEQSKGDRAEREGGEAGIEREQ